MFKLFIVDDERLIRESLKVSIDWKNLGIELLGEASNGKAALEKFASDVPDILLTDIRMPILDGLELTKEIRENGWNIKVIIISGYDDFNYAQEAVELGAIGYILKPIENSEIIRMVGKAKTVLTDEKAREQKMICLEQQAVQSKSLLRQQYLFEEFKSKNYFTSFASEREIISFIEAGDLSETRRGLDEFYKTVKEKAMGNMSLARTFSLGFVIRIQQYISEISDRNDEAAACNISDLFAQIESCETLEEMKAQVESLIEKVIAHLNKKRENKYQIIIDRAKGYIHANYYKDLSLDEVAAYVGISANYLSQLFKQFTPLNFLQYLTGYRIETAKELLKNRELKICDIASRVGYSDPKYFDKIFKKNVDVTPSEYREKFL